MQSELSGRRQDVLSAVAGRTLPANRLRELRQAHNLKPYDLASRYRVDPSTVWRWETGRSQIPDEIKLDLAELFSVPVSELMGWATVVEQAAA